VAPTTEITLRLSVDTAGKLTAVSVVKASDPALAKRLRALLTGLSSRFHPAAGKGAVEITFRVL